DPEAALDAYARVLELYPDDPAAPTALFRAAQVEADRGNDERAEDMLRQVISAYPDSPEAEQAEEVLRG
ncbi:MAG TPA: tetratricopeptide repeat protein, partial [Longimicrobiaceae bacterium]|nr:tetratricopeptide repeat protein [Longimicrobiaceae bacterium]